MTKRVQLARGPSVDVNVYTGPPGEIVIDSDRNEIRLQDGATLGGIRILGLEQLLTLFRASADDPLGESLPESGLGLVVRIDDGAYTTRELVNGDGILITNPAGTGSDPVIEVDFATEGETTAGDSAIKVISPLLLQGKLDDFETAAVDPLKVEFWSWIIESPEDGNYDLIINSPYAVTVNSITTQCVSGTATVTGKIDTTALGGTANAASVAEQTQNHVTANSLAIGNNFRLTISANAVCNRLTVTVKVTRP